MPGIFVDNADGKAIGGIGAAEKILYVQVPAPQVFHDAGVKSVKLLRFQGSIHRAPMHSVFGHLVADDELVFGRTSGAVGVTDEGAIGSQLGFVAADGVLHQSCRERD